MERYSERTRGNGAVEEFGRIFENACAKIIDISYFLRKLFFAGD